MGKELTEPGPLKAITAAKNTVALLLNWTQQWYSPYFFFLYYKIPCKNSSKKKDLILSQFKSAVCHESGVWLQEHEAKVVFCPQPVNRGQ